MSDEFRQTETRHALLMINTVIGLGYLAWMMISVFISADNDIGLLPIIAALAYILVRSVFGRSKTATNIVSSIYLALAGLLCLAVVTGVGESISEGDESISSIIPFVLTFLSVCLVLTLFGTVSLLWGRRLTYDVPLVPTSPRLAKFMIAGAMSVCFVGCSHLVLLGFTEVETAEHVASVSWLPEEASDICYYRSYSFTAYEFDISEQGFLDWAESGLVRWDIRPIEEPVSVTRYRSITAPDPPFDWDASNNLVDEDTDEWERQYDAWRAIQRASISDGLYYGHESGNGGGIWVAYDSDKGRAYYHSTPR